MGAPALKIPDFQYWVLKPDCTGRLGWEPPTLPDNVPRAWDRWEFDNIPKIFLEDYDRETSL